jgi:hypothetical protein
VTLQYLKWLHVDARRAAVAGSTAGARRTGFDNKANLYFSKWVFLIGQLKILSASPKYTVPPKYQALKDSKPVFYPCDR